MRLCDVEGKGPSEEAVLISRLEEMELEEEILSPAFHPAMLNQTRTAPAAGGSGAKCSWRAPCPESATEPG